MKALMNKIVYVHVSVWMFMLLVFGWILWSEGQNQYLLKAFIFIGSGLLVFYAHVVLLNYVFYREKRFYYVLGLLIVILLGPLPFHQLYVEVPPQWTFLSSDYFAVSGFVFFFLLMSALAVLGERWFINTLKREHMENQKLTTELQYLKAQINPHFLFNTLNNIHTLAYMQSPITPDAIMRLSSLMRYMLYESNSLVVYLEKELQYLQDYIELQQLRYSDASIVKMDIAGPMENLKIAPLLFIHLLENAYKHSPGKLKSGDIKVSIKSEPHALSFKVCNPLNGNETKKGLTTEGIGLQNLKKRLELIYPKRHTLKFAITASHYEVQLYVNFMNERHG